MKEYADVYKTPGAFSWNELMTSDPEAATRFYGQLFGWSFDAMNMGGDTGTYHVAKVGETSIAGMMKMPAGGPPMPPAWGSYVTVANLDETVGKVVALGGSVVMPPMDVPKVGRMAVIADPQGAVLSLMQYSGG